MKEAIGSFVNLSDHMTAHPRINLPLYSILYNNNIDKNNNNSAKFLASILLPAPRFYSVGTVARLRMDDRATAVRFTARTRVISPAHSDQF
jgi:hypothetical protein